MNKNYIESDKPAGEFDEYLNIIQGNQKMCVLMGTDFYVSLYNLIKDGERQKVSDAIVRSGERDGALCEEVVHIRNADGEDVKYVMGLEKQAGTDHVYVELTNISKPVLKCKKNDDILLDFTRDYLTLSENVMFLYSVRDNRFRLFWINHEQTIDIYNMDFDEWIEDISTTKRISENDMDVFQTFCDDVKSYSPEGNYSFRTNLFSSDTNWEKCKINFWSKEQDGEQYVLGNLRLINELTGEPLENYVSGDYIDALTGIFNKKAITNYAKKVVEDTSHATAALMILDIDNFKTINDSFGHLFGDSVIKEVADVLRKTIGKNGAAGRFGGDEFMVILNDATDELVVRNYLRAIKTNINMLFQDKLKENKLTCSIGVARSGLDSNNYRELFLIADKVLYIAKQKGKNRYIIYKPELHKDYVTGEAAGENTGIKSVFYSDKDLFSVNRLLRDLVLYGSGYIQGFVVHVEKIMMVDRVMVFWGPEFEMIARSNTELDGNIVFSQIVRNDEYLELFNDDMLSLNNVNTMEYSMPEVHNFLKKLGVCSTIHYLLRDKNGEINGLIVADVCETVRAFPKLALQIFGSMCNVINAVLIKESL